MRNDLRREKKLPGFFDREVYDILDHGNGNVALGGWGVVEPESDFEPPVQEEAGVTPNKDFPTMKDTTTSISEQQHQPLSQVSPTQGTSHQK
ncbi:hypothetical protein K7X08_031588 [Anisodus acutangulus]|uniref:Uncharacterized protein n=1 Tax=Anisodus acutangulus TaxID=402998 RepID=A0A9Q1RMV6_9SOLA|nr:hypothetical protein K7X08_031588 [Anisodus acutangulus]